MEPNSAQYLLSIAYVQKQQSEQPGSEFFDPMGDDEPEWIVRQAVRLLCTVGNELAVLNERLQRSHQGPETPHETRRGGYQENGVQI